MSERAPNHLRNELKMDRAVIALIEKGVIDGLCFIEKDGQRKLRMNREVLKTFCAEKLPTLGFSQEREQRIRETVQELMDRDIKKMEPSLQQRSTVQKTIIYGIALALVSTAAGVVWKVQNQSDETKGKVHEVLVTKADPPRPKDEKNVEPRPQEQKPVEKSPATKFSPLIPDDAPKHLPDIPLPPLPPLPPPEPPKNIPDVPVPPPKNTPPDRPSPPLKKNPPPLVKEGVRSPAEEKILGLQDAVRKLDFAVQTPHEHWMKGKGIMHAPHVNTPPGYKMTTVRIDIPCTFSKGPMSVQVPLPQTYGDQMALGSKPHVTVGKTPLKREEYTAKLIFLKPSAQDPYGIYMMEFVISQRTVEKYMGKTLNLGADTSVVLPNYPLDQGSIRRREQEAWQRLAKATNPLPPYVLPANMHTFSPLAQKWMLEAQRADTVMARVGAGFKAGSGLRYAESTASLRFPDVLRQKTGDCGVKAALCLAVSQMPDHEVLVGGFIPRGKEDGSHAKVAVVFDTVDGQRCLSFDPLGPGHDRFGALDNNIETDVWRMPKKSLLKWEIPNTTGGVGYGGRGELGEPQFSIYQYYGRDAKTMRAQHTTLEIGKLGQAMIDHRKKTCYRK